MHEKHECWASVKGQAIALPLLYNHNHNNPIPNIAHIEERRPM